jgi:hypothetical protein
MHLDGVLPTLPNEAGSLELQLLVIVKKNRAEKC